VDAPGFELTVANAPANEHYCYKTTDYNAIRQWEEARRRHRA